MAVEEAGALWALAASANWHATASVVARARTEALMIDMGSTTTDVVPIADGLVRARGMKDHDLDGEDDRLEGAGDGAMTGGVLGAGAGLLAGLGMLAVPGLGPIVAAGWLAATATGAAAGAVTGGVIGGILGALTHEGVDRKDAEVYAESIKRGGAVVVVRNHGDRKREIEQALSDYSTDATARGDYYRSGGWAGYDESGDDTWDESRIAADREAARSYRPTTRI